MFTSTFLQHFIQQLHVEYQICQEHTQTQRKLSVLLRVISALTTSSKATLAKDKENFIFLRLQTFKGNYMPHSFFPGESCSYL